MVLTDELPDWTVYEWPRHALDSKRLGQAHRWFFFDVVDASIEPSPDGTEFSTWQWVEPEWLVDHVVAFRRSSYRRALGFERDTARSPGPGSWARVARERGPLRTRWPSTTDRW